MAYTDFSLDAILADFGPAPRPGSLFANTPPAAVAAAVPGERRCVSPPVRPGMGCAKPHEVSGARPRPLLAFQVGPAG